jgi:tetratricopeptide (TPR) repeat protein
MNAATADTKLVRGAIGAALFLGTLLLFVRVLGHDFVNYDDPDYVTANPRVQAGLAAESVRWAFASGEISYWHPLTWLSHMADWELFGANPRGHHAVSVVWHAVNAALAFVVLRRLTGALWASALAAAWFAWHPLRAESVAWVAERKDLLGGFFWFAALGVYAGYAARRAQGPGAGAGRRYAATLALFAGGLMSKPSVVALPAVLLIVDFWPLRRWSRATVLPLLVEKFPFVVLAAAVSAVTLVAQRNVGTLSDVLPLGARLANAAVAVARYLGDAFVPTELAVLYPHPGYWPAATVAGAVALVAAITAAAWRQRARRPWLLAGWGWFLVALLPMSGVVQVGIQAMADRYTYVPLLGVQVAVLWTLREAVATRARRQAAALVAAAGLAALAMLTWRQLGVWRNSFTLFDRALAVTENNYLAHNNRGLAHAAAGRHAESVADYRRALAINPAYPDAANNLGRVFVQEGRAAEAVPLLRTALAAKPASPEIRNNLANALADTGAVPEAIALYEAILRDVSDHADALNGLGVALAMQGRAAEAKANLEAALRHNDRSAGTHANLGNVCTMLGQLDAAAKHYRRATELEPGDAHTRALLGFTYAQLQRREDAIRELRAALALRPDHAQARAWLEAVSAGVATGK